MPKKVLKFLVEGEAELPFYQVIVVVAEGVEPAVEAIREFLRRDRAVFVAIDEEETEEVDLASMPPEMVLSTPTEEGIIAFGGKILFPRQPSAVELQAG